MEFDIYIPALSLAFEYAGRGHFEDFLSVAALNKQQATDEAKAALCAQRGIALIEIPHWWDGSALSLADYIKEIRPDVHLITRDSTKP